MAEIRFVAHHDDYNDLISVVSKLFYPCLNIFKCTVLNYIVDKKRSNSSSIITLPKKPRGLAQVTP